ncbi:hypothetical protein pVa21_058 [Vibrio phage pVa-21]|nr:hypothetical protein pVa21_058 [Vibrio phage pVa-21]
MKDEFKTASDWTLDMVRKNGTYVAAFLTSSYIYYHWDHMRPICTDETFDQICKELLEKWDEIEHKHKHLISKDDLRVGSGFSLKESDYPSIVATVALSMSNRRLTIPDWRR